MKKILWLLGFFQPFISSNLAGASTGASGESANWDYDRIGIVSERQTQDGLPLIIHNIGSGTKEEDILFKFEITGHYRSL